MKQPVRNAKLCQALVCGYNTANPGQPARAEGKQFCIWCDSQSMDEALGSKYKTGRIKQSLVNFKTKNAQVYESALLRLPPNFEEAALKHPCQMPGCVYDRKGYGQPALIKEKLCVWCDPDTMAKAILDPYKHGRIK